MNVRFYVSAAGRKPAAEYMRDLNPVERAALTDDLRLIQQMGLVPSGVTTKHIGGRLYEIKSKAQRAFYVMVVRARGTGCPAHLQEAGTESAGG